MKTKDFETAIAALNGDIVIDEMKLRHSDVHQVIAHQGDKGIVWDEHGRAFTTRENAGVTIAPNEEGIWSIVDAHPVDRDNLFDLKFD